MHSKVAGATFKQNIIQGKRSKIGYQARDCVWKTHPVMKRKIRPPFDVNVSWIICAICREVGCYQYELFLHQQVYLQSRSMLGRVHDGDVHQSGRYVRDQILGNVDMNAERYVRM